MSVKIGDIIKFTGVDENSKIYPNMDSRYGPYNSKQDALSKLPSSSRSVGLTVGIKTGNTIEEYWFYNGIEDSKLIVKGLDSYAIYTQNGGNKSREDFYNTLVKIVDSSSYVVLNSTVNDVEVLIRFQNNKTHTIGNSYID